MKKFILLLVLVFVAGNSAAQTVITTPAELQGIASDVAGDYVLGNDIDLTGIPFTTIADFAGTFDGAMHTINGLATSGGTRGNGLFGTAIAGSVVKNVGLTNVNITPTGEAWYTAAMVGDLRGELSNCWIEGGTVTLTAGGGNGGTMIGLTRETSVVTDCYSTAELVILTGDYSQYTGGFTGGLNGPATNCYFAGTITGDGATDLSGTHIPFAGYINSDTSNGDAISCYYDKDLVDIEEAGGLNLGRTTAEMMTQATFVDWDFVNIWGMIENETYPTFMSMEAKDPDPSNGATVSANASLELSWTNLDPNTPGDTVYVDVWFGTEPNELHPGYDMSKIVDATTPGGENTESVIVDASAEDTYYWKVNLWINGADKIDDENMFEGSLWSFDAVSDAPPTVEIVTLDQMTWSGEGALLDATVEDDAISALTIEWTADDDSLADTNLTIDILNADQADPTVTITKTGPTDDVVTVTMTVTVSDLGNPTEPDTASIEIDVYNDACHVARVGLGRSAVTDFDTNCFTGLEELAMMVEAWFDDYSATGPADK